MLDSSSTCDRQAKHGAALKSVDTVSSSGEMMKSGEGDMSHLLNVVDSEMSVGSEKERENLSVALEDKELWNKFKEFTNEMIVTKNGRRMFPVFRVSIDGLDANAMYTLLLDFVQVDSHRWKYVNGDWVPGGKAEPAAPNCVYVHPDSPNFGAHWMKEPVNFGKVKLTNKMNGSGQIMLNSLHKYEPRLHICKVTTRTERKEIMTYRFPETQFIAVTAYQNEEITALKIKHNPFAKAFLDAKERPEQREFMDDGSQDSQRSLSHLASTWYLPPGGHGLVPPPAHHQFANLGLPNSHCDRLSLRNPRPSPYTHPYQRRSPPHGNYSREMNGTLPVPSLTDMCNFSRDVSGNLPMLNLTENWPHMSPAGAHSMLGSQAAAAGSSQYGMWMTGNLSPNQNHGMPGYLRTTAAYALPAATTSVTSLHTAQNPAQAPSNAAQGVGQTPFEHPCDISSYSPSGRENPRGNWSPLTPSPL